MRSAFWKRNKENCTRVRSSSCAKAVIAGSNLSPRVQGLSVGASLSPGELYSKRLETFLVVTSGGGDATGNEWVRAKQTDAISLHRTDPQQKMNRPKYKQSWDWETVLIPQKKTFLVFKSPGQMVTFNHWTCPQPKSHPDTCQAQ